MKSGRVIRILVLCCAFLCLNPGTGYAFTLFGSKQPAFECAFEEKYNPPLDVNSEAHKLYTQARDFELSKEVFSEKERQNVSQMYLQAMEMGHWKAKAHMIARYSDGIGVDRSSARATMLAWELMRQGVPIGYFNFGLFTMKGWGTTKDEKEGMRLIHKAAAMGSKDAQYMLGEYYIYQRWDYVRGLKYHVCAMRQGHAKSASAIASYMEIIEKNYPIYIEYLLRAGGLGNISDLLALEGVFTSDHPDMNHGFKNNPTVAQYARKHLDMLRKNPKLRFPNIGKECPLPEHPTLGNGRQLPSKLKEACGGMWPDEAYPELKDW